MKTDDFLDLDELDNLAEAVQEKKNEAKETKHEDLDDLLNEEPSKKQKSEKQQAKKEKKKKKGSIGKVLLKTVLPATLTLIGGFVGGIMLGNAPVQSTTKSIDAISNKVSLEDRVSNIKDAQMSALNAQISDLLKEKTDIDNKAVLVNGLINQAVKDNLNNFFGAVLTDNYQKSEAERVANIKQYFDINENNGSKLDEYSQQIQNNMNNFVASNSLAKQLKTTTAKAGNVFASILAVDKDLSTIYQVIVPTVTEDNTVYQTLYIVRVNTTNKITAVSYVGYVDGDEGTGYFDSFKELIENKVKNAEDEHGSTSPDKNDVKQNTNGTVKKNKKDDSKKEDKDKKETDTSSSNKTSESSNKSSVSSSSDEKKDDK